MGNNPDSSETKQHARSRTRSTKAIGESEEWLFATLESIGDAVIATDAAGSIVFMNAVAVTLTGWSEDEAQGKDCRDVFRIVNETTRLETESPVNKVLRDGVVSGLANHTILIARNGVEHSIDDSGSPIHDKEGRLIGVVLIFRDITARRKIEITLKEQQDILQTLFDHIPVIVTFMDEKEKFKWVNREWSRVVGWSLEEMQQPERLLAFYPYAVVDSVSKQADSPPNEPVQGWRDFKFAIKEGRLLDLSWATVRLSDGSSIGIGQDVTQRKSTEELKAQYLARVEAKNQRLEQAMRETDHRVKNNLQSVAALLDIQLMDNEAVIPAAGLRQVRMHILTLASIHDMLVKDVMEDTGYPSFLSARAELQKLLPMLQKIVGPQRIEWSADDVNLPVKQGMSLAVLINELVNNAVKHGGHKVELRLVTFDKKVMLEVSDDGPGFAEDFHPQTAANFGLELVESVGRLDLGGQTTYENRPQGGASVRVTFPLSLLIEA